VEGIAVALHTRRTAARVERAPIGANVNMEIPMRSKDKETREGTRHGVRVDLGLSPVGASSVDDAYLARRNVLLSLGVAGAAAVGGAMGLVAYNDEASAAPTTDATSGQAHQWCRVVDLRACKGERKCTSSCQKRHGLPPEQTWMRVLSWKDDGKEYFMPVPCQMCENPPCVNVCPVSATFQTAQGVILVDQDACIGSRACMAACPYEARYFNWRRPEDTHRMPSSSPSTPEFPANQIGTVGKCVLCADLIPYTKELPACVPACPNGVHYIGDFVTDVAVNGRATVRLSTFLRENNAVRFKEELGTNPRTYYILGNGQRLGGPPGGAK
jgi:molybdopterin-containing oxidoreductase family iron-sulfur binding subunit